VMLAATSAAPRGSKVDPVYPKNSSRVCLYPGGRGGMMFNIIVVQDEAKNILDLYGIKNIEYEPNYFVADAVETVAKLTAGAIDAGVKIYNLISVEDVKIDEKNNVTGVVINWSAVGTQPPKPIGSLRIDWLRTIELYARGRGY